MNFSHTHSLQSHTCALARQLLYRRHAFAFVRVFCAYTSEEGAGNPPMSYAYGTAAFTAQPFVRGDTNTLLCDSPLLCLHSMPGGHRRHRTGLTSRHPEEEGEERVYKSGNHTWLSLTQLDTSVTLNGETSNPTLVATLTGSCHASTTEKTSAGKKSLYGNSETPRCLCISVRLAALETYGDHKCLWRLLYAYLRHLIFNCPPR